MRALVAGLVSLGLLAGCGKRPPPPVVAHVDLGRYAGRWYEIARLPAFFQRVCVRSWADYEPVAFDRLAVVNTCDTSSGERRSVRGEARVVDPATRARLLVTFDTWFAWLMPRPRTGNYWIFALDPAYQTALVGTPDRSYLWILARHPRLEPAQREALVAEAQRLGFDTSRLVLAR
jgi:apolipoprotein D and lipocalin family protein